MKLHLHFNALVETPLLFQFQYHVIHFQFDKMINHEKDFKELQVYLNLAL